MDDLKNQQILAEREQTRAALSDKFEELERRAHDKVRSVKTTIAHATDISYQVNRRPWKMLGLSLWGGYAVGRMLSGRHSRRRYRSPAQNSTSSEHHPVLSVPGKWNGKASTTRRMLKGATIGVAAATARILARQALPTLIAYVEQRNARQKRNHGQAVTSQPTETHLGRGEEPQLTVNRH